MISYNLEEMRSFHTTLSIDEQSKLYNHICEDIAGLQDSMKNFIDISTEETRKIIECNMERVWKKGMEDIINKSKNFIKNNLKRMQLVFQKQNNSWIIHGIVFIIVLSTTVFGF